MIGEVKDLSSPYVAKDSAHRIHADASRETSIHTRIRKEPRTTMTVHGLRPDDDGEAAGEVMKGRGGDEREGGRGGVWV